MLQYDENVVNSQPRRTPRLAKDKGLLNARQPSTAKSSSRRPLGVIPSDVTPMGKRTVSKTPAMLGEEKSGLDKDMVDSLRSFAAVLDPKDADYRDMLIELLEEDPRSETHWSRFLRNERAVLVKLSMSLAVLAPRLKLARRYLTSNSAELLAAELLETPQEQRAAYGRLRDQGLHSSTLFLTWAALEQSCGDVQAAVRVLNQGLDMGALKSPGRSRLAQQHSELAALQAETTAPEELPSTAVKKKRAPRRRLLGSLGGAARIKPAEQKPLAESPPAREKEADEYNSVDKVKEHNELEESMLNQKKQRDEDVVPPPPSIFGPPDEDAEDSTGSRGRRVKFASPHPAPAGPRVVSQLRGGSLSPIGPSSMAITGGNLRSQRSSSASASATSGTENSPKRISDVSFTQQTPVSRTARATPVRVGNFKQADLLNVPGKLAAETPSRVLFQSAVKLRKPSLDDEYSQAAAVSSRAAPMATPAPAPAPVIAVAAPVAIKRIASTESSNGVRQPGEKMQVGERRLRVLETLGAGGYSRVYKVIDRDTYEIMAMKDVEQKDLDKTFANEVRILGRLAKWSSDINVRNTMVQMRAFEETSERSVLLLELGELDLTRLLMRSRRDRKGMLPVVGISELRHYWRQMLKCVAVLHEKNIVHCDLKPANFVMFQGRLKLVDFGIAVQKSKPEPQTKGTLNYLPPELCARLLDHEKRKFEAPAEPRDIWAMGCILYELAYERPPFKAATRDQPPKVLMKVIANPQHTIVYPECEQPSLNQCIAACLRYAPETRPTALGLLQHQFLDV